MLRILLLPAATVLFAQGCVLEQLRPVRAALLLRGVTAGPTDRRIVAEQR